MAKQDLATYWKELAASAGLSEEQFGPIAEALNHQETRDTFSKAFVREPDFQAGLAKTREEWQGKTTAAETEAQKVRDWYKEAKPVFDQGTETIQTLAQYKELYGDLDGDGTEKATTKMPENVITKDQLDKMLADRDAATVNLVKTATRIGQDHFSRFKEPLPVDEVEKFALENKLPLDQAYDKFIQPKVDAQTTASWEEKLKAAKAEGEREALSRHKLPTDASPSEPHPFFDKREEVPEDRQDQRAEARDAFMEELHRGANAA